MRAAGVRQIGGAVELLQLPAPRAPQADEVLLDVQACGVGNWDEFVRTGGWDTGAHPPMALGVEAAGPVAARSSRTARGFAGSPDSSPKARSRSPLASGIPLSRPRRPWSKPGAVATEEQPCCGRGTLAELASPRRGNSTTSRSGKISIIPCVIWRDAFPRKRPRAIAVVSTVARGALDSRHTITISRAGRRPAGPGRPARSAGRPRRRPGSARASGRAARTRHRSSGRPPRRPRGAAQ